MPETSARHNPTTLYERFRAGQSLRELADADGLDLADVRAELDRARCDYSADPDAGADVADSTAPGPAPAAELPEGGTLTVTQAARALHRRPETLHRWIASGRLATVQEANGAGRLVRRVTVAAVNELIADGARGSVVLPAGDVVPSRELVPVEVVGELPALSDSTVRDALAVRDAQIAAAAARLDAPLPAGYFARRRARRDRDRDAAAAVRLLAALPR